VLFRDDQRFSYLAGDLKPLRETAEAIIDWFDLHGSSEMGAVAFRRWPAAMRGRFIARFPPLKP
jgi:predicted metal-binding protein